MPIAVARDFMAREARLRKFFGIHKYLLKKICVSGYHSFVIFNRKLQMLLIEYLAGNNLTVKEFAKKVGMSRETIYQILNGHTPNKINQMKIQKATEEMVTFSEK